MIPHQHRRRRRRAVVARPPEKRVTVTRGPGGFGFTIAGQRPCIVSAVALDGPAERAGLRAGDALLAVDGANVSRVPHGAVARLIAAAPQSISLLVIPRECPPTDTEDTEPDERARTRRRHPPPRRRPQPPLQHRPGCQAAPSSTSNVNEILQNITRAQLSPTGHMARLECRAIVGYLGTIETPRTASETPPGTVRNAVRRLRQERRPATPVLLSVLPNVLILRNQTGQALAQYSRDRIIYAGSSSDADRRYFGLVTSAAESLDPESSFSCHVFSVDPRLEEHQAHIARAREFQIGCTRDPVAERCLEFPPSAEYVVGVIKGMYSLPAEDTASPVLQQISKLAIKGDSPGLANFSRCNRAGLRVPRIGRRPRCEENGHEFVANSPQPSNHSEITTTSSNSDSGIGFHNDGHNVAERILVVDFAQPMIPHRRNDAPRRPIGVVGCNVEDGSFLSNTTPVVDGFGGQGRPLNHLDDVILNPTDVQALQGAYKQREDNSDSYNFNSIQYSNVPSTSRSCYENIDNECHYELIPPDICLDNISEGFNSVEFYEESRPPDLQSNEAESIDNVTVISGTASKASMDSVSIYSAKSHEETRPVRERHMQASLDDMLLGINEEKKDDDNFVHPATIKYKVRKSKPLGLLSKTKHYLSGKDKKRNSERSLSASAGDVCAGADDDSIHAACSEPDLRQSDQSSPFRRWTAGNGASSSYRHHEHRNMYNKQISEGTATTQSAGSATNMGSGGGVARWSLGLEHLLADPAGAAAFAHFLHNEFAGENIRFWWSCEQYAKCTEASRRATLAQEIWSRHLADGASDPVNIDAAARRAAALRMHQTPPDTDLFQQAQKQIFNVMKFDSYPRFLRSGVHAECARADLRGLPPPYGTHNNEDHTPTKLKKSVSNASERRRSGGASLLPWKLRAASKDRVHTASSNSVNQTDSNSVTDVVKSTTSTANGFALCRVVLPDGATSVVGVDPNVPVRRLLDKLLQRRNITCTSYDVLVNDQSNGAQTETSIDVTAPSTVLSGREVRVERRCVVRVEIAGRCVAVRCRAHRTIRHALRPVLRRYCPHQPGEPVLTRDNGNVQLDTLIQDLDGARLQVTFNEESDLRSSSIEVKELDNDDIDSMNELAVRLHEDLDAQSTISSSRSEYGTSGHSYGTNGINGMNGNTNSGYANHTIPGNMAGGAGRVRAALRPGPPLHHHPPDFLENLRETQRVRLHAPRGVDSALRSPPPLPPKPRPAPPTNI